MTPTRGEMTMRTSALGVARCAREVEHRGSAIAGVDDALDTRPGFIVALGSATMKP
jgi:hypothetical protein